MLCVTRDDYDRAMRRHVLHLAERLELCDQNDLLLAAGYAPEAK
jgi:hypothetical protein